MPQGHKFVLHLDRFPTRRLARYRRSAPCPGRFALGSRPVRRCCGSRPGASLLCPAWWLPRLPSVCPPAVGKCLPASFRLSGFRSPSSAASRGKASEGKTERRRFHLLTPAGSRPRALLRSRSHYPRTPLQRCAALCGAWSADSPLAVEAGLPG